MSLLERRRAIGKRIRREELRKAIVVPTNLGPRGISGEWVVAAPTDYPPDPLAIGPWADGTAFDATPDATLDDNDIVIVTEGLWRIFIAGNASVLLNEHEDENRAGIRLLVNGVAIEEAFTPVPRVRIAPPPLHLVAGDRISAELVPSLGDVLPATFTLSSADIDAEAVLMTELR